jgi:hypothetical protein
MNQFETFICGNFYEINMKLEVLLQELFQMNQKLDRIEQKIDKMESFLQTEEMDTEDNNENRNNGTSP